MTRLEDQADAKGTHGAVGRSGRGSLGRSCGRSRPRVTQPLPTRRHRPLRPVEPCVAAIA